MRRALEIEIAACRRVFDRTVPKALLRDGMSTGNTDGGEPDCYRFAFDQWPSFREGRYMLIRDARADEWVPAEVIRLDRRARLVTLRTSAELGDRCPKAQLREDEARLLERLADRLAEAGSERSRTNLAMSRLVLGDGEWGVGQERHPERYVTGYDTFNPPQRHAVSQALASTATFVWGPPGTGKTDVVAAVVEGSIRLGLRVLLLAPTNVALDQALYRSCERLADHPDFDQGLIQRHGPVQAEPLDARYGDRIDHRRTADRLTAEFDTLIERLRAEHATVSAQVLAWEQVEELRQQIRFANAQHTDHRVLVDRILKDLNELEERIAEIDRQLAPGENGTRLGWLRTRSLRMLTAEREELSEEARIRRAALVGPLRRLDAIDEHRRAVQTGLDLAAAELADPGDSLEELRIEQARCEQRLAGTRARRRALLDQLADRCRLQAATTVKAYSSRLAEADVVIVDEAGMVDLAEAFYVAGLARTRVVFAGDFRQLPAIVNAHTDHRVVEADQDLVRTWLARDVFRAAGLVDDNGLVRRDPRLVPLNIQYRMTEEICALVNAVAYPDAPLRSGRREGVPLPGWPTPSPSKLLSNGLVLIDTSAAGAYNGRPTHNLLHATLITELVRRLDNEGTLFGDGGHPLRHRLAVIAPYREQVAQLNVGLSEVLDVGDSVAGGSGPALADTVHRFQGSQRPIVIVDTVEACEARLGNFYSGTGLDSNTTRLLNVALSRAAEHMVVVANVDHLRRNLLPGSEVLTMLEHLVDHAQHLAFEDLVPALAATELADRGEIGLDRPAFFRASECFDAIGWDLEKAVRRIEIFCPFLNEVSVHHWLARLRRPLARGVQVTVHTREPSKPYQRGLYEQLEHAGCRMVRRPAMHEKVVIVDDVLWHGSMNVLGYGRSTDLMVRMTSRVLCEQVIRMVAETRPDSPPPPRRVRLQGMSQAGAGDTCPRCEAGTLVVRRRRDNGRAFLACSRWSRSGGCAYTRSVDASSDVS